MAKTILVIEDDKYMREVLVEKLQHEGYEVMEAVDGQSGFNKTTNDHPDLIILDIILPVMNGFEYLEKLKDTDAAQIPVLILSNLGQKEDIDRGMELGAKDYIIKAHFTPNDLIAKVRALL